MASTKLDPNARYAKTHEWVRVEEGVAVVGVSDAAQEMLSDVVYVDLPEVGQVVTAGKPCATVESVKAAEDVYAPVSGTVIEVNSALDSTPEIINERPYDAWFFRVEPAGSLDAELAALMAPDAYAKHVEETAH
jgi:glycine cleavage system H protein